MSSAFDPPTDELVRSEGSSGLAGVMTAWMTSGAILGLAAGLTAQLVGGPVVRPLPIVVFVTTTTLGLVAWLLERRASRDRPALLDARGRLQRPPHALLYAAPLALAVPGMAALVIVATIAMGSALPGVLFGLGGFGLGWASRRLFSSHRITSALQALEVGDAVGAIEVLEALETGWMSTRRGRTLARLNLGMLALTTGDLDRATRFYTQVTDPVALPMAHAGMALVRVLQERYDEAERIVHEALASPGAEAVQGQLDAVRLLLTLRKDGTNAAHALGRTLHHDGAGELFRGIFALALVRSGDIAQARRIADDHLLFALEESGWRQVVPEIADLLVQPELG